MYVILVYDVNEKRIPAVHRVCRRYLFWVQNSVFEGELTEGKFKRLKRDLERVIDKREDSIIFYKLMNREVFNKEHLGKVREYGDRFMI